MRQRPAGWLAPVRGAVLAALVTLLTATGHVVGGGTLVSLSPLAVLVPLLAVVLVALAERCRGIVATLLTLGAGQLVLHVLLIVLAAHDHRGSADISGAAFSGASFSATAMLAAHAVATLVTALVVSSADATVVALLAALRRVLPRRPPVGPVDVAPPARPVPDLATSVAGLVALAAHARRGPPRCC